MEDRHPPTPITYPREKAGKPTYLAPLTLKASHFLRYKSRSLVLEAIPGILLMVEICKQVRVEEQVFRWQ